MPLWMEVLVGVVLPFAAFVALLVFWYSFFRARVASGGPVPFFLAAGSRWRMPWIVAGLLLGFMGFVALAVVSARDASAMRGGGVVYVILGITLLYAAAKPDSLLARLFLIPKAETAMRTVRQYWCGALGVFCVLLGLIFFILG